MPASNRKHVLSLLREAPGWVTGTALAGQLGISRMGVCKHVATLNQIGYAIERSPTRGYRFQGAPDLLLPDEIRCRLDTHVFGQNTIHYYPATDSTNTRAKEAAAQGEIEGALFMAEHQTAGRGRRGRPWLSDAAGSLCFSLLLRPAFPARELTLLPLLTAVAVCEAIRAKTALDAKVKWPNDILIGGKKCCGILTEAGFDLDTIDYAVVGIGLNINKPARALPREIRGGATSLQEASGTGYNRAEIARAILAEFELCYLTAGKQGFAGVLERWRALSCTLGQHVRIRRESDEVSGVAEDLTPEGGLLLRLPNGSSERIFSGDLVAASA